MVEIHFFEVGENDEVSDSVSSISLKRDEDGDLVVTLMSSDGDENEFMLTDRDWDTLNEEVMRTRES